MYSGGHAVTAPGACILDADGLRLDPAERDFFREADPWGFILFARNIDTPEQVRRLTGEMREAVGRDAVIMVDQEGGRVQRLRGPHWTEWPAPLDVVKRAGPAAAQALYLMYRILAHELRAVGINANCAPTCDIAGSATHPFLFNRCLGTETYEVVANARAVSEAHLDAGVLPIIKHMPGHGRATADSHENLPHVHTSAEELDDTDFAVFRNLSDLPAGMTAHVVYDALDRHPATCSAEVIAHIREVIGFGGLLMTDDLSMRALSGTGPQKAAAARAAGCDLALYCNQPLEDRRAVADAAGRLSASEWARATSAEQAIRQPRPIDIDAARAEFETLVNGKGRGADAGTRGADG